MTMYIFDEKDEYYRCPAGGVEVPGSLVLSVKLLRGYAANPRVYLYPDGGETEAREISMGFDHLTGAYDVYKSAVHINTPGLYWYRFLIDSTFGDVFTIPENAEGSFQITAYSPCAENPDWLYGGVIYHIFVDRFYRHARSDDSDPPPEDSAYAVFRQDWGGCPYFLPDEEGIVRNNDFFGGDLRGVIEKLPYLEEMGVTCLYLSPVFEAASNHKYDTGDFMKIDPAFGGDEAFEQLCAIAKSRGIRIILDGVFNHVGSDSRYFNRYGKYDGLGAYQSADSPYRDWFYFREDGTYASWWGIELLPSLNKQNGEYIDFICGENGVIAHWTRKGVSGWRLDVVDELPDYFLDPLHDAIKRENTKALIVGEVWEDASNKISYDVRRRYFTSNQLDSVTNYTLKNAIIACVKDGDVIQLADVMASLCKNYPAHVLNSLMNILGTHDTARVLTALSGVCLPDSKIDMSDFRLSDDQLMTAKRRLRLASLLQFTLPGVPCVYYGDEAGMEGGADPFNRRCYPWGYEDLDLIRWYKGLSRLRKERGCFKDGKYTLIEAREGMFAFIRGSGRSRVLIAVNVSDTDRILNVGSFNFDLLKSKKLDTLTVKAGESGVYAIR
ncbi:MAG: glycoside hydrolase family 13 protein [Oscillospiraceae bacterium]|nr:glycoside hydrolase family 13 protein [Oscillospiraceae bacterium]